MRLDAYLFLDIDGTLLDSRHQVMPCTHNHMKYLHGRGIPIILCSTHPPEGVNLVAVSAENKEGSPAEKKS